MGGAVTLEQANERAKLRATVASLEQRLADAVKRTQTVRRELSVANAKIDELRTELEDERRRTAEQVIAYQASVRRRLDDRGVAPSVATYAILGESGGGQ